MVLITPRPLVWQAHYEKKATKEGALAYRHRCIITAQALARGFLSRRRVHRLLMELHPEMKRDFCATKISAATDKLVAKMATSEADIDDLFAELDASVARSRKIINGPKKVDWDAVRQVAMSRPVPECPICLGLVTQGEDARSGVLLSCSHVFHTSCIEAFENFSDSTDDPSCPVCRECYTKEPLFVLGGSLTSPPCGQAGCGHAH